MENENEPRFSFDESAPITPQVHQILRDRIITADLPPGSPMSEPELARQFGISRQPVRESLIKLAEEGLVQIRPQRRTLVTKIDFPTVMQSRFLREAVESDIVSLLATTRDDASIEELRAQLAHQNDVATTTPREFIREDRLFHQTLAKAAGKEIAWSFVEGVSSQMDRVRALSLDQSPAHRLVAEHSVIVDAIERRDPKAARAAMRKHLKRIIKDLPMLVETHKDYFARFSLDLLQEAS